MSRTKVLLPFNFTGYDRRAMDFVIRTFAPLKDHKIWDISDKDLDSLLIFSENLALSTDLVHPFRK
jgi:hypothetical protein